MIDPDQWAKEQATKPLSMFELGKWWAEGLKMLGAGNGAGVAAAGAALVSLQAQHHGAVVVKIAGLSFFIGVFAFAGAFTLLNRAIFAQDEVAHATLAKDVKGINKNSDISAKSMMMADYLRMLSMVAFFIGCCFGIVAFVQF